MLTLGVIYYIILLYYILYVYYYISYILSYTILSFSFCSFPSLPIFCSSHLLSSNIPLPIFCSSLPIPPPSSLLSPLHLFCSSPNHLNLPFLPIPILSHTKYTCRHFLTVIYIIIQESFPSSSPNIQIFPISHSRISDPACFIGWECRVVQFECIVRFDIRCLCLSGWKGKSVHFGNSGVLGY